MSRLKARQAGDTIVEVLICLAIVGGALTVSYGIARRSLVQIRDSQERAEMLSVGQTQLEKLKSRLTNDTNHAFYDQVKGATPPTVTDRSFCLTNDPVNYLYKGITDPHDVKCAVDQNGNFYMDSPGPHCSYLTPGCIETVDQTFPYRVVLTYRPQYPVTSEQVDEWYVLTGRLGAGGHGNAVGFSIVPLMYRQSPP